MYTDQTKTVRAGRDGSREVVYQVTTENGKVTARKAVRTHAAPRAGQPRSCATAPRTAGPRAGAHQQLRRWQQRLGPHRGL